MQDDLIRKVAQLMCEQTGAFLRLESATIQLAGVLVQGEPNLVESLAKAGEKELLKMRSRLLEITTALTEFAELRAKQTEKLPLDPEAREQFEQSANLLLEAAKNFQRISARAGSLALSGSAFVSACIQMCGLPPVTYRPPVLRNTDGGAR